MNLSVLSVVQQRHGRCWRARQAVPVIGVIGAGERGGFTDLLAATRLGLKDFGFIEGQNFEYDRPSLVNS